MTKNQIAMRNIAVGTADTVGRRGLISGREYLKPKCLARLLRDPEGTCAKWDAMERLRSAAYVRRRAERERIEAQRAEAERKRAGR